MTKLRDRWWEASLQLALACVIIGMYWYFAYGARRDAVRDPGAWIGLSLSAYMIFAAFKRFAATLRRRRELIQRAKRLRLGAMVSRR